MNIHNEIDGLAQTLETAICEPFNQTAIRAAASSIRRLNREVSCPDARNHHLYTKCGTCGWQSPDRLATFRAQLSELGL